MIKFTLPNFSTLIAYNKWTVSIIFLLFSGQLQALTVGEYKDFIAKNAASKEVAEVYLAGIGQGIFAATAFQRSLNQAEIFCPPVDLVITGQLTNKIFNDALAKRKNIDLLPANLFLINELVSLYPCK